MWSVDDGGLDQDEVDEFRLGIETQVVDELSQHILNVFDGAGAGLRRREQ
jgi:hypothetical protein